MVPGLAVVRRQLSDNAYTRRIVELAFLGFADDSSAAGAPIIELMQYLRPAGRTLDLRTNDVGVGHVALAVADLAAEYERLRAQGVEFRNPPVEIDAGLNPGGWACYLLDPDGITIELMQPAPGKAT